MTSKVSTPEVGSVAEADVVVIGDGPAGSALAAALHGRDVDVALVGPGQRWAATYTTWVDELEDLDLLDGAAIWSHRFERIAARFGRSHTIEGPYGVIENDALRAHLQHAVRHVRGIVETPVDVSARVVVDATGWPSKLTATDDEHSVGWQTAFGVLLAEPPPGPLGQPTMMDYSDPGVPIAGRPTVPSFAYAFPVGDGWLVEETVLTASPAIEPSALLPVLASRLGTTAAELLARSIDTEEVRIPMGAPPPPRDDVGPIRFGASAGMIHPATGYSIGAALRSADRVAASIETQLALTHSGGSVDTGPIRSAVWSLDARRTRQLHDYGHDVLAGLDRDGVCGFFDAFFDLDRDAWTDYLRIDTKPQRLAGVMTAMFRQAPWRLRARLVTGDLRRFSRLWRP